MIIIGSPIERGQRELSGSISSYDPFASSDSDREEVKQQTDEANIRPVKEDPERSQKIKSAMADEEVTWSMAAA